MTQSAIRRIRFRRDFPELWAAANPTLSEGEPGYEKGTGKMKVGDGVTPWNELEYFVPEPLNPPPGGSDAAVAAHINSETPHPVYDNGPSFLLFYENQKV